jgi:phosphoribosylformylglycinamidine synthase II
VPTVGGEIDFHPSYNGNILVNAMAVGVARGDGIFYARASGIGNRIIYLGSKTGRDGIHGATMASDVFDEKAAAKRPAVQVGDPFTEKLLIECSLELMGRNLVVGVQDMGAAGLTSSSFEMAARASCGLELDLSSVPVREKGMTPYEIMLSESQERMLMVVQPDDVPTVLEICRRWGLDATDIGQVILERVVRATFADKPAFSLPVAPLVDDAPRYDRPHVTPKPVSPVTLPNMHSRNWNADLALMLGSPQLGSADRVFEQYDQSVGAATVVGPGADAALVLVPGTNIGIGATVDCNSMACGIDAFWGAAQAVAEAVRNLACVGAEPVGVTDCLNFGSPENPEVMGQFVAAVEGMSEACRSLGVPVVSGNVSFYNETSGSSILPTPAIGMVGLVPDVRFVPRNTWREGEAIYVLGPLEGELGGSRYLQLCFGVEAGPVPAVEYDKERRVAAVVRDLVRMGLVAAKDISDGGLAMALGEMTGGTIGAVIELPRGPSEARIVFGEWLGRFVVSVPSEWEGALVRSCQGLDCTQIGLVQGEDLIVRSGKRTLIDLPAAEFHRLRDEGLQWLNEA